MRAYAYAAMAAALVLLPLAALAGKDRAAPVTDPAALKECGACHLAFPAEFLPAASWRKIMSGLSDHFGEDAGLSPAVRVQIENYLVGHAGGGAAPDSGRISDLSWWRREHRKVAEADWRKAKSKANCQACHQDAAKGLFDED